MSTLRVDNKHVIVLKLMPPFVFLSAQTGNGDFADFGAFDSAKPANDESDFGDFSSFSTVASSAASQHTSSLQVSLSSYHFLLFSI